MEQEDARDVYSILVEVITSSQERQIVPCMQSATVHKKKVDVADERPNTLAF